MGAETKGYFVIAGETHTVNEAIARAMEEGFEPVGLPSVSATLIASDPQGKPVIAVVIGQAMRRPVAVIHSVAEAN